MPEEETKLPDGRIVRSEAPLNLDFFFDLGGHFPMRPHHPIKVTSAHSSCRANLSASVSE